VKVHRHALDDVVQLQVREPRRRQPLTAEHRAEQVAGRLLA
jgi:hypothetical protein